MSKDYYRILGVSRNATSDEIKRAYRKLALRYHPDMNRDDPDAEEHFKEITEAYGVLIDPSRRRLYNADQQTGFTRETVFNDIFSHSDYSEVFRDIPIKQEWLDKLLRVSQIIAYEAMVHGGRPRDIIRRSFIKMAFHGASRMFHNVMDIHQAIYVPHNIAENGGYVTLEYRPGFLTRRIKVKIPPGTRNGTVLRVPGMGRKGIVNSSGDLYLHIDIGSS